MLSREIIQGVPVFLRKGTTAESSSDEESIAEVVTNRCYAMPPDFDVEQGEQWLDLGANIGAFAVYCGLRGATVDCYEPDATNFRIMARNLPSNSRAVNAALSNRREPTLRMFGSPNPLNHWRCTLSSDVPTRYIPLGEVANVHASILTDQKYDGVKMDIEGSEGGLIDEWLLPACRKLVFEYHTSRDCSVANLGRRLSILKNKFVHVRYPDAVDVALDTLQFYRPDQDFLVFCWEPRG